MTRCADLVLKKPFPNECVPANESSFQIVYRETLCLLSYRRHWHWICSVTRGMKNIILCSSNPILVKSLYGMLRDDGHCVDAVEHPAPAVHLAMRKAVDLVIIDSEPFGLSSEDAAAIIRTVAPDIRIIFIGKHGYQHQSAGTESVNLEELRKVIHGIAV